MIERVGIETSVPLAELQALQAAHDRLREELMRVGSLAVSERQDGCIAKTTALCIREIAYRACWPAAGPGVDDASLTFEQVKELIRQDDASGPGDERG